MASSLQAGFRDVAELLLQRGFTVSYETIRGWEFRFAPLVEDSLRKRRTGRAGHSWYLDGMYVRVSGQWHYLYRAIDVEGSLLETAGHRLLILTTDKHPAYRKALHRTDRYLNNWTAQSHRHIKQRFHPMLPDARVRELRISQPLLHGVR